MRAGQVDGVIQRLGDALARHLQHAEIGDATEVDAGFVHLERLLEHFLHFLVMFPVAHVDEIDHDQAAQVAQPQLSGHLFRGLHVGLEGGVFNAPFAAGLARVNIDRNQRFGRFDDQGAAGWQRHALLVNLVDLLLKLETGEDRAFFLVKLDQLFAGRHVFTEESLCLVDRILAVNQHFIDIIREVVTDEPDDQTAVAIDLAGAVDLSRALLDALVHAHQAVQILL